MDEKQRKTVNMLTLAFGMAFMPPIWAVLALHRGRHRGGGLDLCRTFCGQR